MPATFKSEELFRVSGLEMKSEVKTAHLKNDIRNKLLKEDEPIHDWYRFVLSFPPHLVREYLQRFSVTSAHTVLDPFCGTGTTLVESKKMGIASAGVEANHVAYFVSQTKVNWGIDPSKYLKDCIRIAERTEKDIVESGCDEFEDLPLFATDGNNHTNLRDLSEDQWKILSRPWISPIPLHKTLLLLDNIRRRKKAWTSHQELALAKALVTGIGNIKFGPEIGATKPKKNVPVVSIWLSICRKTSEDLQLIDGKIVEVDTEVENADVRSEVELPKDYFDIVITSPPYPNEKDYTRTTRLESVILGFLNNKKDLRALKENLLRSNTRNVYVADQDHEFVKGFKSIKKLSDEIERRRIELNKDSGFERLYHRVVPLYFGGMMRHLEIMKQYLKPGAKLAYVVGDQMSYLRVHIKTGEILAEVAESIGYRVDGIDLWRERMATATKTLLREEVVVLTFPGS